MALAWKLSCRRKREKKKKTSLSRKHTPIFFANSEVSSHPLSYSSLRFFTNSQWEREGKWGRGCVWLFDCIYLFLCLVLFVYFSLSLEFGLNFEGMLVRRRVMSWRGVAESLQALAAHGLLFSFTLLLGLKLDHVVHYSWWYVIFTLCCYA